MENYVLEQIEEIFEEMGLQYHCNGKGRIGVGLSDYCLMFHAAQDGLVVRGYLHHKPRAGRAVVTIVSGSELTE